MRRRPEPVTAAEVRAVRLQATKFREGYDQDQVDDFLDRVAVSLAPDGGGMAPDEPGTRQPARVAGGRLGSAAFVQLVIVAIILGVVVWSVLAG